MEGLAVTIFPVIVILFALGMERFEARLSKLTVPEVEIKRFLDGATTDEVATLADMGMTNALNRFHRRLGDTEDEQVAVA